MRMTIIGLLATLGAAGLIAKVAVESFRKPTAAPATSTGATPAPAPPPALPAQVKQDVERALQQGADRASEAAR